ncbi:lipopolysaccharide heptosyltransferase II [Candidatus Parcubacteria bacterium]|nr:MAG: lipopolysaccharide heptosyltransferase II [Candidatus Parcubacteria bacterium]
MPENILICGTNWLGDSVMSMPAIQAFKAGYSSCRLTMLVKPKLYSLWSMHRSVDAVMELGDGLSGVMAAAASSRHGAFDRVFVFPNSFRSALVPFLAQIPVRIGVAGHCRQWMLTSVVRFSRRKEKIHQAWEYVDILGLSDACDNIVDPRLSIPEDKLLEARDTLEQMKWKKCIGLMPGAAYGPAKRWPADYFVEVGREFAGKGYGIAVMGSMDEVNLCAAVSSGIGDQSLSLAGRTSLPQLAALLGVCSAVVTNDSGGMHLASAVGAPVVAVFGITDPSKTGPLGKNIRVILGDGTSRSRDIERSSAEAESSLRSIKPGKVCEAVWGFLDHGR